MVDEISLEKGSLILWNRSTHEYRFIHKGIDLGTLTLQEVVHPSNGKSPTKVIIEWVADCKAKAATLPAGDKYDQKAKRIIKIPSTITRHAK